MLTPSKFYTGDGDDSSREEEEEEDEITSVADEPQISDEFKVKEASSGEESTLPAHLRDTFKVKEYEAAGSEFGSCSQRMEAATQIDNFRLDHDFIVKQSHGHGSYGQIFHCEHLTDRNEYAIKRIKSANDGKIPIEIKALSKFHHKNVVRFYQVWKERYCETGLTSASEDDSLDIHHSPPDYYYLQMEFCSSTIEKVWEGTDKVDTEKAWDLLMQLAEGIQYIHQQGFIHCDISPTNVLLNQKDEVKICDFGLARFKNGNEDPNVSILVLDRGLLGNTTYRAPELVGCQAITEKVDIYSLGVLAVDLFHYSDSEKYSKRIEFTKEKKLPECFKDEHPAIQSLLLSMVDKEPTSRPSADEVLSVLALKKKGVDSPVVIIVGAPSRISIVVALALLKAGCKVLVNFSGLVKFGTLEVIEQDNAKIKAKIMSYGDQARIFASFLSEEDNVALMIKTAVDAWGRIDIMINNEGNRCAAVRDCVCVSLCTRAAAKIMMENKKGKIINIATTKFIGLLTALAARHYAASNITVNAIVLGSSISGKSSPIGPCEGHWQPDEIASFVEMLALSSAASNITGHVFRLHEIL